MPTRDGKIETLSIDNNGTFINTRYEESRLNFDRQGQKLPLYEMKDGGTTRTVNSWTCDGNLLKLKNQGNWYYELKDNNLWLKDRAENAKVIRVFSKTKQPSPLPADLLQGIWHMTHLKEYHDPQELQLWPNQAGETNTLQINKDGTHTRINYGENRLNFDRHGYKIPQYEIKIGDTSTQKDGYCKAYNNTVLWLEGQDAWTYELKNNNQELWLKDRADKPNIIRVYSKIPPQRPLPSAETIGTWYLINKKEYHDPEPLRIWPNRSGETNTLKINKDGTHTRIHYGQDRHNFSRHGHELPLYEIKNEKPKQSTGYCKSHTTTVMWLEDNDHWTYEIKNNSQELWLKNRADKPNIIYVYSKTPPKNTLPSAELIGTWHIIKQKEYHDPEPLRVWPNQTEKTHTLVINKDGTHSRTNYEQYRLNFNNYGHELPQYQIKDEGTAAQKEGYAKSYYDNVLWLEGQDAWTYEFKNDNQELWLKNRVKDANTIYIYSKKSPQNTLPPADLTGTWHMIQMKEYHDSEPFKIWPTEDGKNNTLIINKDGTHTRINYQKERLNLSRYGYEQLQYQIKNEISEKKEGYAKSYYGDVLRLENQEEWYYELKGNELYLKNRLKDANTIRIYSKTPPQSPLPQASLIGTWNIHKIKWHDSDLLRVTPHEKGDRDSITIDAKGTHLSTTYNHSRRQFANEEKTYTTHGDPKKRSGFCRSYFGNVLILENMGTFSYEVNDNELSLKDLPTDPRSIDLYKKVSSPKTPAEGTAVATKPVTSTNSSKAATADDRTSISVAKTSKDSNTTEKSKSSSTQIATESTKKHTFIDEIPTSGENAPFIGTWHLVKAFNEEEAEKSPARNWDPSEEDWDESKHGSRDMLLYPVLPSPSGKTAAFTFTADGKCILSGPNPTFNGNAFNIEDDKPENKDEVTYTLKGDLLEMFDKGRLIMRFKHVITGTKMTFYVPGPTKIGPAIMVFSAIKPGTSGTSKDSKPATSDTKVSGATQETKTGATSTKTSGTTQGTKTETAGTKTSGTTQEAKTGATGKKTTDSAQEAKTGAAGTKVSGATQETKTGTTGTKASGTTQGTKTTSPTQKTQTYDEAYDTDIPPFPANLPVPTEEDDYEFMQVYLDYVTTHKEYTILKASAKELGVRIPPGKLEQALDAYRKAYNKYKNMALTRKK